MLAGKRQMLITVGVVSTIFSGLIVCLQLTRHNNTFGKGGSMWIYQFSTLMSVNFGVWGCAVGLVVDISLDLWIRSKRNAYFVERCGLLFGSYAPLLVVNIFVSDKKFISVLLCCVAYQSMMTAGIFSTLILDALPLNIKVESLCFTLYSMGLTGLAVSGTIRQRHIRQIIIFVSLSLVGVYFLHFMLAFIAHYIRLTSSKKSQIVRRAGSRWKLVVGSVSVFAIGSLSALVFLTITTNFVNTAAIEIIAIYLGIVALANVVFVAFTSSVKESQTSLEQPGSSSSSPLSTDFIRYVSHEIRTPLNVASIGMELINGEAAPNSIVQTLAVQVQQSLSDANGLLQNIMDYEEFTGGKIKPNNTVMSALDTCRGAVEAAIMRLEFHEAANALSSKGPATTAPPQSLVQFYNHLLDDNTSLHVDEVLLTRAIINTVVAVMTAGALTDRVFVTVTNVESSVLISITNRWSNTSGTNSGSGPTESRTVVKFEEEFDFCLYPGAYNPQHDLGLFIAAKFVASLGGQFAASHGLHGGSNDNNKQGNSSENPQAPVASDAFSSRSIASRDSWMQSNKGNKFSKNSLDLLCTITLPVRDFSNGRGAAEFEAEDVLFSPANKQQQQQGSNNSPVGGDKRKVPSVYARIHSEVGHVRVISSNRTTNLAGVDVMDSVPEGQGESRSSSLHSSKSSKSAVGELLQFTNQAQLKQQQSLAATSAAASDQMTATTGSMGMTGTTTSSQTITPFSAGNDHSSKSAHLTNKMAVRRNITELMSSSSGSSDQHDSFLVTTGRTWSSSKMSSSKQTTNHTTPDTSAKDDSSKMFIHSHRSRQAAGSPSASPSDKSFQEQRKLQYMRLAGNEGGNDELLDPEELVSISPQMSSRPAADQLFPQHQQEPQQKKRSPPQASDLDMTREYTENISFKGFDTVTAQLFPDTVKLEESQLQQQAPQLIISSSSSSKSSNDSSTSWMQGKRMLVVASAMSSRNSLCSRLVQLGATAVAAVDRMDAMEKLLGNTSQEGDTEENNNKFDGVFVEYGFSEGRGEYGPAICRCIRENGFTTTPIVGVISKPGTNATADAAITESGDMAIRAQEEFMSCGATVVFTQPLQWNIVCNALQSLL